MAHRYTEDDVCNLLVRASVMVQEGFSIVYSIRRAAEHYTGFFVLIDHLPKMRTIDNYDRQRLSTDRRAPAPSSRAQDCAAITSRR